MIFINGKIVVFSIFLFFFRAIMMKPTYDNAIDTTESVVKENKVIIIIDLMNLQYLTLV